jgi:membrane protein
MGDEGAGRLKRAATVVADAIRHLNADDGWAMASHVALSGLMAVFPFLIFVTALAGFVGQERLADRVADLIFQLWPEGVAGPIVDEVHRVVAGAEAGLLTISAVVAAVLASSGVAATRVALNRAYRVVDRRAFLRLQLQSLVFIVAGAAGLLALAFFAALVPPVMEGIFTNVPALRAIAGLFTAARFIVPIIIVVAFLTAAHVWLPAGRPPLKQLWPGVVLTLVLWAASAVIFAIYLAQFSNLGATYGGLASVVAAMFFLYIVAASLIFGAEFNAALTRRMGAGARA